MSAVPKSPLPGMDPYLEQHWQDVHQRLCTYACDDLQTQLGGNLIARLGERLVVESLLEEPRVIYPDVRVVDRGGRDSGGTATLDTPATEPIILQFGTDPVAQGYVEIIEADSGKLITVIEFLSPSNKLPGDGRDQYRRKHRDIYLAKVNLVEIDLVRVGRRTFILPEAQLTRDRQTTYLACVFRGHKQDSFELYPIPLHKRLANLRIPLRETDKDIVLDLQRLIDMSYRNGRHDRTDYRKPCIPPLEGEEAAWAHEVIRVLARC